MSNYYFLLPDNKPETFIEYTKKLINSGEFPFLREGLNRVEMYNEEDCEPSLRVVQYNSWCFYGKIRMMTILLDMTLLISRCWEDCNDILYYKVT